MTGAENERLAIVETKVDAIVSDVGEIKGDVKTITEQVNTVRRIVDRRTGFGDAFRTGLPLLISLGAVAVAVVSMAAK